MTKPRKLTPGGRVAAISLSWGGPGTHHHRYEAGKKQFMQEFGLEVVETKHALRDPVWLAEHPEARAGDLMEAFADPSIDGITRPSAAMSRYAFSIDPKVIAANPKVFLGYSDTTVTHLACHQAGLVSFYGPAFMSGFAENGGMFPYMTDSVRKSCFSAEPIGIIEPCRDGWTVERLEWGNPGNQQRRRALNASTGWKFLQGSGVVRGRLIGGCLEVLDWLRGTPVWPALTDFDQAILFLEISGEAPSPRAVARFLRSLAAMGILKRLSGILLGRPGGGVSERFSQYDDAILQVVKGEEGLSALPLVTQMDFGHTDPMFVLPCGVLAQIDCGKRQFAIIENAVVDERGDVPSAASLSRAELSGDGREE